MSVMDRFSKRKSGKRLLDQEFQPGAPGRRTARFYSICYCIIPIFPARKSIRIGDYIRPTGDCQLLIFHHPGTVFVKPPILEPLVFEGFIRSPGGEDWVKEPGPSRTVKTGGFKKRSRHANCKTGPTGNERPGPTPALRGGGGRSGRRGFLPARRRRAWRS